MSQQTTIQSNQKTNLLIGFSFLTSEMFRWIAFCLVSVSFVEGHGNMNHPPAWSVRQILTKEIAQWPLLTLKTIVKSFVWYKSSTPGGIEVITLPTEESAAKLSICRTTQSSPTSTMEGLMTVSNIGIIHLRIQKRSINFSGTQVRLTSLEKQAFPNICNRTTSHAKDKMVCYECNLHSNGF